MVDALALGASGAIHGGSNPLPGTKLKILSREQVNCFTCGRGFEEVDHVAVSGAKRDAKPVQIP